MRNYVTGLGYMTMAGVAMAQAPKPAPPLVPQPVHSERIEVQAHRQLFIAPSGEPFRAIAGAPYPVAAWFAQADANHDGRIDLGEFNADFMRFFDRLDTNHDRMLSSAEIKAYETDFAPEVAADYGANFVSSPDRFRSSSGASGGGESGGSSDGSGPPSAAVGQSREIENDLGAALGGGGRYGLIAIAEPVAAMDTSFSGHVSRGEAQAAAQRRFNLLDPDDKGAIGLNDLPRTIAEQRSARRR
ncbi:EF-hand domain-containing protein [Sphingomonas sp. RB1R13]|uniref:EF-hand domain-containing protein n=1 Tax=Sphingomonas sp. RB1R13 TaxID=3096159 RepID=UPI002FC77B80